MAILVTGGAGYIGSAAVEQLLARGEEVAVIDDFSSGHHDAITPGAIVYEGNILDAAFVRDVLGRHPFDTVMHFAAFIVVPESCADPAKYFENNVTGAHTLLNEMRKANVLRFIFSSTAAVYGHPATVPITEDAAIQPLNPYGISKRMVEQILEWYDKAYGMRYCVFRYFNAAGATLNCGEDHSPESHLIPNVFMAAEGSRDALTLFGTDYPTPDGSCVRDYIHIEDLVGAHVKGVQHLRQGGGSGIYNLGNSVGISNREIAETVKSVTGKEFTVKTAGRRAGDSAMLIASSQKARDVLGWSPEKSDIETIVKTAWAWRQAHPDGYAR